MSGTRVGAHWIKQRVNEWLEANHSAVDTLGKAVKICCKCALEFHFSFKHSLEEFWNILNLEISIANNITDTHYPDLINVNVLAVLRLKKIIILLYISSLTAAHSPPFLSTGYVQVNEFLPYPCFCG